MRRFLGALIGTLPGLIFGIPAASAGSFVCTSAITSAQATAVMGVPAQVVTGGGGEDDCGISARGFNHITITGYVVKRSFFDDLRRKTRSGTVTSEGIRVVHTQRALQGFGGPAFSLDTKSFTRRRRGVVDHASRVRLSQWPDAETDRGGAWARQGCIGGAAHTARAHRNTTPLTSGRRGSSPPAASPSVPLAGLRSG